METGKCRETLREEANIQVNGTLNPSRLMICADCNVSDLDLILICAFVKSRHQGALEADSITSQLTERTGSALTQRLPGALLGINLAVGRYF